ncbi:MAG: glycosyltransferase family 4 protein [Porphyromonadaceae bacterium]|nr:glycosyltransferase family 4 protein [Porphyromonadaceae bacterium]
MKLKRIAFVGNSSFSIYKFRLGVMKNFIEDGYSVYAIAPEDDYSTFFEKENIKYIPLTIDAQGTNILKDILYLNSLINIYKQNNIDFIFHYTIKPIIYGSFACRFLKIPSIAITTGLGYAFESKNFLNKIVTGLYRASLKSVLEVWFLNKNDKEVFLKNTIIPENKTFILNGEGIDSNYYFPVEKEEDNKKLVFLLLSRLIKDKGIKEYVNAARILKSRNLNVECQLLGKVEPESSKTISINEVNSWHSEGVINYLGESIDVRDFIAKSDCVVLPSHYNEGVPRCLMEGMSMEKPIITTNNVGCIELIRDGVNGFMCTKRDPQDLADKMEKMSKLNSAEREEMGKNGRALILEKFDEKAIIKIYKEKLEYFLSNKR